MGVKRAYKENDGNAEHHESISDSVDGGYASSDDSIDMTPAPSRVNIPEASATEYGIGASLMQKMGYTAGEGLGVNGTGMLGPIEVEKRQKRAGLGVAPPSSPEPKRPSKSGSTRDFADSKTAKINAVRSEMESVRQQQDVLKRAIHMIEREGEKLDLLKFHDEFSREPEWYSEKLYEVAASVLRANIPFEHAFFYLYERPHVVETALKILPEEEWGKLLRDRWLSGLMRHPNDLLEQWLMARPTALAAAGPHVSRMFKDPELTRLAVAKGPEFLVQLIGALPDASFLTSEIKRSLLGYPFQLQSTALALVPIESAVVAKIVSHAGPLMAQTRLLISLFDVLSQETLSDVLESTDIRELWLQELVALLQTNSQDSLVHLKLWWDNWRPFFAFFRDDSVEPWLEVGLNATNAFLDGVRDPVKPPDQAHKGVVSTPKDVLEHFCYMNNVELVQTTTGFTVRGTKQLNIMFDGDLLLVRQADGVVPISFDTLRTFVLSNE